MTTEAPPNTVSPIGLVQQQLSEAQRAALRESVLAQLHVGVTVVEFRKANGELTAMECTLDPALLPPPEPADPSKPAPAPRPPQPHLVHCYSLDRGAWRSFKLDSVIKMYRKPDAA